MQREIKFRGKRVDNGEFIYGYLYQSELRSWITDSRNINLETHRNIAWFQVIPETVGQYTGLNDRKKREMCEGDIVKRKGCKRFDSIGFCDGSFTIEFNGGGNDALQIFNDECEIVGTIHDNPELLTQ